MTSSKNELFSLEKIQARHLFDIVFTKSTISFASSLADCRQILPLKFCEFERIN